VNSVSQWSKKAHIGGSYKGVRVSYRWVACWSVYGVWRGGSGVPPIASPVDVVSCTVLVGAVRRCAFERSETPHVGSHPP
jgi:hypothetical protein